MAKWIIDVPAGSGSHHWGLHWLADMSIFIRTSTMACWALFYLETRCISPKGFQWQLFTAWDATTDLSNRILLWGCCFFCCRQQVPRKWEAELTCSKQPSVLAAPDQWNQSLIKLLIFYFLTQQGGRSFVEAIRCDGVVHNYIIVWCILYFLHWHFYHRWTKQTPLLPANTVGAV